MLLLVDDTAYWTKVTALATAAAVIVGTVAAIIAIASIWYQGRLARRNERLGNIWKLTERWSSADMRRSRALAAYEIKRHKLASELIEVLNFFDDVGFMLSENWIDSEDAWGLFSTWILPYWHLAKYEVEADRIDDPLVWRDAEYLVEQLVKVENMKLKKKKLPPYMGPSKKEVDELFHGEISHLPGALHWRQRVKRR